jgi:hypothetical protein
MKRTAGTMMLLAALSGCVSTGGGGAFMSGDSAGGSCGIGCGSHGAPSVPGVQGPRGEPVAMAAPYSYAPPSGKDAALAMLQNSVPLDLVQQAGYTAGKGSGIVQAQAMLPGAAPHPGSITPPGVPMTPGGPAGSAIMPTAGGPPGAVAGAGALTGGMPGRFAPARTEVRFVGPSGTKISWYTGDPSGRAGFTQAGIEAPGRYNFAQASIYRLKLSNIPGRPGLELYPTLEVVPVNNKTATFLAHSAVPVNFTEEDFEQVTAGNYVVKVIYLPDPQHQDLAAVGADEVVSSRLEPGVDPIAEACKRGSILLVIRLGNIDLEAPNTPAMDAPSMYQQQHGAMPPMPGPGMQGASPMVPYGMIGPGRATAVPGGTLPPVPGPAAPGMMAPPQTNAPGTPLSRLPDAGTLQPTGTAIKR